MITFEIGDADDPVRHVFARETKALLLVDYNGDRKEFDVPREMTLMPQSEIRYEL